MGLQNCLVQALSICICLLSFVPVVSCEALATVYQLQVGLRGEFTVLLRELMLVAVRSAVVWGPPARGMRLWELLWTSAIYRYMFLWGSGVYKALMSVHQSRDCVPW